MSPRTAVIVAALAALILGAGNAAAVGGSGHRGSGGAAYHASGGTGGHAYSRTAYYGHGYHGSGSHWNYGVSIGFPLYWGSYWGWPNYYPPYYGYPANVVTVPAGPTTYIEQAPAPAAAPQAGYWYYCSDAKAYYPYVRECPGGWQPVSPQPPAR